VHEIYDDLDIKNCHPVVLEHLIKNNPKYLSKNPHLITYNNNRDEIFRICKETMGWEKDKTKTMFLRIINQGGTDSEMKVYEKKCPLIYEHYMSMKKIFLEVEAFAGSKEWKNKKFKASIKRSKKTFEGSLLNRFLCYYENKALQIIVSKIIEFGGTPGPLQYDGVQILKKYIPEQDIFDQHGPKIIDDEKIKKIEDALFESLNIPLKLEYKKISAPALELKNLKFESVTIPTEVEFRDLFYKMNCDDEIVFTVNEQVYFFSDITKLWTVTVDRLTIGLFLIR
jgi:hypothetical protein